MGTKGKVAAQTKPLPEMKYSTAELAANAAHLFGYSVDIARAAFDCSGISECSLREAEQIIKSFAERRV